VMSSPDYRRLGKKVCYTSTMKIMRNRRPFRYLFFGLLSLAVLIYIIVSVPPNFELRPPVGGSNFAFSVIPLFFILLFTSCFFLSSFLFKNRQQGILIGIFASCYLLFRLQDLTHPFFLFLLLALFLTLELFLKRR